MYGIWNESSRRISHIYGGWMDAEKGSSSESRGRRVLIVDDNKDVADALAMNLASGMTSVTVAHDGIKGLEAARASVPDVVILDIGMADPNGYEVARTLREEFVSRRMLLVAVTGWAGEGNRKRAMEAGFDHHLVKPVAAAALLALIEDWEKAA